MEGMRGPSLGTLRLLQLSDSSFPVGGFAYSHGLEWLAHEGAVRVEADLEAFFEALVAQALGGQTLPAALRVARASSERGLLSADDRLDASIGSSSEREAGRAMGGRLLTAAMGAFGGGALASTLAVAVHEGRTPGQYATAFAAVARDEGASERETLLALASGTLTAVAQAAIRLGLTGQDGASRLVARASGSAARVVEELSSAVRIPRPGAFAPGTDVAGTLHARLPFRMFAS